MIYILLHAKFLFVAVLCFLCMTTLELSKLDYLILKLVKWVFEKGSNIILFIEVTQAVTTVIG